MTVDEPTTAARATMRTVSSERGRTERGGSRPRTVPLGADLAAAIPDAAVAAVLTAVVFLVLRAQIHAGTDPAAREMPNMIATGGIWAYSMSQALGFAALTWAWLTVLLGLTVSGRAVRGRPRLRGWTERLHRSTSLTVVLLIFLHAATLLWDTMGDTPVTLFVPFATHYTPGRISQALGIFSLYLAVLVGPSYYLRDRIGRRFWRVTHRWLVPAVYVLGVWHTFSYGSDLQGHSGLRTALWIAQVPIVLAFAARLLAPARPGERLFGRTRRQDPTPAEEAPQTT
jgi:methionine sulfoxide reductase heme-binding subunit